MTSSTKTDPRANGWASTDRIERLRVWGSDEAFWLPTDRGLVIGTDPRCTVRLVDKHVSRRHAELSVEGDRLMVRDTGSKNGIRVDGATVHVSVLEPGSELGVGNQLLVAESTRLIGLRSFLERVLGWGQADVIDLALRAVRMEATRRATLLLRGKGDLVPVAHGIHARSFSEQSPFVVCDPRRRRSDANARSVANVEQGAAALQAARGGALCVRSERLPRDFSVVASAVRDPTVPTMLVVCGRRPEAVALQWATIDVPPLAKRKAVELARVIDEYGGDARRHFEATEPFTSRDREWVRQYSATSYDDLAKGTMRLVALRTFGNVARAADALGITHVSLSEWLRRRRHIPDQSR